MQFLKDIYFWIGLVVFIGSLAGMLFILKRLQKEPDSEELMTTDAYAEPELQRTAIVKEIKEEEFEDAPPADFRVEAKIDPVSTVRLVRETPPEEPKSSKVTLETLAGQVHRMESLLEKIADRVEHLDSGERDELISELQELNATLRANPMSQANELGTKMDKIYKVLVSLSNPDEK